MAIRKVQELDISIKHCVLGDILPYKVEDEIRFYIFYPDSSPWTVKTLGLEVGATMKLRADVFPVELKVAGSLIVEFCFTGSSFTQNGEIDFSIYQISIFRAFVPI
jgi:hypothetical protein